MTTCGYDHCDREPVDFAVPLNPLIWGYPACREHLLRMIDPLSENRYEHLRTVRI